MTTPNPTDIDALRLLDKAATPGPWKHDAVQGCKAIKGAKSGTHRQAQHTSIAFTTGLQDEPADRANASLIVAMRNALPQLLDELAEKRAENERLSYERAKLVSELARMNEHYKTHMAELAALRAKPEASGAAALREALETIVAWGPFPATGRRWENGIEMSYGAAFGSNGERDYMRQIARAALAASSPEARGGGA